MKFYADNMIFEDRSSRLAVTDDDKIKTLIRNNHGYMLREVAELHLSHIKVIEHLHKLKYMNRFDVWVPYHLPEKNLIDHISICNLLLNINVIKRKRFIF